MDILSLKNKIDRIRTIKEELKTLREEKDNIEKELGIY